MRQVVYSLSMTMSAEAEIALYLCADRVTVSQSGADVVAAAIATCECTSLICLCRRAASDGNALDCVDCGGCLLYQMPRPIIYQRSLLVSLHPPLEVDSRLLECELISRR